MIKENLKEIKEDVDPIIYDALRKYQNKDLHNLIVHQVKTGGKRLRPFLLVTIYKALEGRGDPLFEAAAIELFHNYSLLLDDIIDEGVVRRGKPTTWNKFGLAATLCSSSFYFSTIVDLLNETPKEVVDIFVRETKEVMEGEFIDVLQDRNSDKTVPRELKEKYWKIDYKNYLKMVKKKTGALFRASCGMGAALVGKKEQLAVEFGDSVGVSYQVRDDILDIFGDLNSFGKEIGKDIKERKGGNIVLIFANEEDSRISKIFDKNQEIKDEQVEEMMEVIKETKARERAQNLVDKFANKALKRLEEFPDNENREKLEELVEYIKVRKK